MATAPAKLTRREAADYIGVRYPTLCTWATTGGGPPFLKVGAKVVYLQRDLDEWLASRRVTCTAELNDAAACGGAALHHQTPTPPTADKPGGVASSKDRRSW